jgi:hypothetical protein
MFPGFDPSKMDPKTLMQLTELIRQLPPDRIVKMQSMMHNMMAGFDVKKEMEEFEMTLPPDFRQKLFALMASQPMPTASTIEIPTPAAAPQSSESLTVREARLTVLRAVAEGQMTPEAAEVLLFKNQ